MCNIQPPEDNRFLVFLLVHCPFLLRCKEYRVPVKQFLKIRPIKKYKPNDMTCASAGRTIEQ